MCLFQNCALFWKPIWTHQHKPFGRVKGPASTGGQALSLRVWLTTGDLTQPWWRVMGHVWQQGIWDSLSFIVQKEEKQLQSFAYGPGIDQTIDFFFFLKYCEESLNYGHLTHEEYWGSKVMKCPAQGFPLSFWGGMILSISQQLLHTLMIRLGVGGSSDR